MVQKVNQKEVRIYVETNENENTTYGVPQKYYQERTLW